MIKRTLRGFNKLKKKYYTPKVKARLKTIGKGLVAAEKGSSSLVGNDDPYGSNVMFSNQFSNQSTGNSFSDNNSFLMGFQQRQAPVVKRNPVRRKVRRTYYAPVRKVRRRKVYYAPVRRRTVRRKVTRTVQPQQQSSGPFGNFQY